jgi:hypothetical protein
MSFFSTVILNFAKFRLVCSTHFCSVETCGVNSLLWYLGPIRFILLTFKLDLIARNSSDFYNFSLDTGLQWFWKLYGHSVNIKLPNSRLNFGNACIKSWQRRIIRVLKIYYGKFDMGKNSTKETEYRTFLQHQKWNHKE